MTNAPREWLIDGLATAPGEEFLRWLVRHVARTLDCEWALVWERCGERWERARVVAASRRGAPGPHGLEIDFAATPLAEAADDAPLVIAGALRDRFPAFAALPGLRAESCAALAIADGAGRPLGGFMLLDTRPFADPAAAVAALQDFRPRVAGELASRRAVRELELLLATARAPSGEETLRELAAALSRSLHAKMGFVCELLDGQPLRARMLACSIEGRDRPAIEYALADTPCSAVYERAFHFEPDDVQRRFPEDRFLGEIGARSFLGVRLDDGKGRPMGHFGVIHDAPLDPRVPALPMIRLFADRAAAELARMRAERERMRAEHRLLEARNDESLGLLARGIANDFNNLLVGILGQATLALAGSDERDAARAPLAEIEKAARRAADLAQQMLAWSGRGDADLQPLDLSAIVEETNRLLCDRWPAGVALELSLSRDLPPVLGDARQLRQVVTNLLQNGAESIGPRCDGATGGRVRVTTGRARDDGGVFVEVQDDGCGMDAATRARLFEPFFTTKEAGRGLGLALVQRIVRGHRGALRVTSAVGGGSCFRLLLPAAAQPRLDRAPPPVARAASSHGVALVVDDEQLVRTTTRKMLERLGFAVCTAADGRAGVEAFTDHRGELRLVLLDLTMPRLSGEEALREMRRVRADVPVILTSGHGRIEATQRIDDAHFAGFLQKPFGLDELERCVRAAVARAADSTAG